MNWTVEGCGDVFAIVDEMDVTVATVPFGGGDNPLDTAEGRRAVLLASAPALLAALEQMVEWLDRTGESRSAGGKEYEYVTEARAAVARAREVSA